MSNYLGRLIDQVHVVTGLAPTTPSTSTPDYVSLRGYGGMLAIICVDNGSTVTGSAITLKQASVVAGSDEAALEFDTVWSNIDTDAASVLAETAVTSNTFTTDTTNAKNLLYVIDVPVGNLDEGFDCVRVGTGDAANMVLSVTYVLYKPKYSGRVINPITD